MLKSSIFFSFLFGVLLLVPPLGASAFETEGVPTAIIGDYHTAGEPIHQEITKDGLHFLKTPTKQLLADQHPTIELDQSSPNHFDNCQFTASIDLINSRYDNAVIFLNPDSPNLDGARNEFGKILHSVQDFYSHTNWIEMKRTDLVDPWYEHWKPLNGYSSTTHENPVFVLEQRPNGIFSDYTIFKKDKTFTVNHDLWDATGEGRKAGLISGTYGEAHESHCPTDASIPHGDKLLNRFFRTPDYTEFPNELNKDNPAIKGHKAARTLATEQTTHEFCRLVVLTNENWGMRGVNLIYDNWVEDKKFLEKRCPAIEETFTSIRSGGDSYIHDSNPNYISKPNPVEEKPAIPDWFKSNAKWWKEGLISDGDIVNALESLIIQDVIPLDEFVKSSPGLEHTAGVPPGGTFVIVEKPKIPSYQKDVFGFWSDGKVSDSEIINSIGHLMSEGIINSEKIQEKRQSFVEKFNESYDEDYPLGDGRPGLYGGGPPPDYFRDNSLIPEYPLADNSDFPPVDDETLKQIIQLESDILIANNLALEQFLEMQNFVESALDDSTNEAWKQYSENKDKDYMNNAIELEQKLNDVKLDSKQTVQAIKDSQEITDIFFDVAGNYGFDIFVLKTTSEQNLPLLDAPSKIRTLDDLEDSEKYVKKFDNHIQHNLDRVESLGDEISQSSSYSNAFERSDLEDAESRYGGIDSRSGATVCEDDNVCDSDKGEVCAKRSGSTEGKCIPTWFGIAHAWAPVGPIMDSNSKPNYDANSLVELYNDSILDEPTVQVSGNAFEDYSDTESETSVGTGNEMDELISIKTISMNGAAYPISQFTLWQWEGECDDAWHYHVSTGHAVNLELNGMGDPDPDNCGFGKTVNLPISNSWMTQNQIDVFHELTGINPTGSEAQMGGSGP